MRRKNTFSCLFYTSMLYIPKFAGNVIEIDMGGSPEGFTEPNAAQK